MKVLLVCKSMKMENLGVMYLSAVVKQHGHEAKICTLDDALIMTKLWKPDIVGYSVMTGDQDRAKEVNRRIKDWCDFAINPQGKRVISIVGGPHPTFFPQDFTCDNIDHIVQGEGEAFMAELLGSTSSGYLTIDDFPWPDRADFPDSIIKTPHLPVIRDFITSRGCPYKCSYCYNDKWAEMFPHIPRVRMRNVDDVIEEINNVSPEFVYFQDSCFGTSKWWLRDFSRKYRSRVSIPFHCHVRPNMVTEEYVLLLHDANCKSVRIALESASADLRKLLKRSDTTLESVAKSMKLLKKWSIKVMVQNMIGLPESTIEDDLETLEFNIKNKPDYAWVSIFSPYPGTELGDWCKEKGYYTGDYSDIKDNFFDTSFLNFVPEHKEQLECLQKVFALCAEVGYLPMAEELTHRNFEGLVHKIMRKQGDVRLY